LLIQQEGLSLSANFKLSSSAEYFSALEFNAYMMPNSFYPFNGEMVRNAAPDIEPYQYAPEEAVDSIRRNPFLAIERVHGVGVEDDQIRT